MSLYPLCFNSFSLSLSLSFSLFTSLNSHCSLLVPWSIVTIMSYGIMTSSVQNTRSGMCTHRYLHKYLESYKYLCKIVGISRGMNMLWHDFNFIMEAIRFLLNHVKKFLMFFSLVIKFVFLDITDAFDTIKLSELLILMEIRFYLFN